MSRRSLGNGQSEFPLFRNIHLWLPSYIRDGLKKRLTGEGRVQPKYVFFCICDHFEPYWNRADAATARKRINRWLDEYPKIAEKYRDSDGQPLKYSFFYPEEEYRFDDVEALAGLCRAGFGEVEIHLHHENDTSENLRKTLLEYKKRLYGEHGLLSVRRDSGEISYGFIHGNWALDNSRPDRRWCGVNDEITVLQETGCYADFTMPSAPSDTQTRKVNSIYYAVDDPGEPKSHDRGIDAETGKSGEGLLMVQGPLGLTWHQRKFGLLPRIENGGLYANSPPTAQRVKFWIQTGICVQKAEEYVFIKIYTHGAQEGISDMLFGGGFDIIFSELTKETKQLGGNLRYVSAREMINIIKAIEAEENYSYKLRDYIYS